MHEIILLERVRQKPMMLRIKIFVVLCHCFVDVEAERMWTCLWEEFENILGLNDP